MTTAPSGPYRGLTAFEDSELDALFFFGRGSEREVVVANLMAARLTVLYGQSGVGKSSLLRAGVAHALRGEQDAAAVVFSSWTGDPVRGILAAVGVPETAHDDGLAAAAEAGRDLYLILDQFEEYFLYHEDEDGPGTLSHELPALLSRPELRVNVLLAVREDSLAKLDRFKGRIPIFGNYLRLDHLDRAAARSASVHPIERWNELTGERIEIEAALVEAVLDEVATGELDVGQAGRGSLGDGGKERRIEAPYLQLVLERLWEAERATGSSTMSLDTLKRLGGAEAIVRAHLQGALEGLTAEQKDAAASAFDHLVTPTGTKIAHRLDDLLKYAQVEKRELEPVLEALARERIVREIDGNGAGPKYEIFHDVLADGVLGWRTQRELERQQHEAERRNRRLIAVASASIAALAVMVLVTAFALTQRSEARSQARHARARELGAMSLSELAIDPLHSLQLALTAAGLEPSRAAEDHLRAALAASRQRSRFPGTAGALSADGRRIAVGGPDGSVRVMSLPSGRPIATLKNGAPVESLSFGQDGILLAVGGGEAHVWGPAGQARYRRMLSRSGVVAAVPLADLNAKLATVDRQGVVGIWFLDRGNLSLHFTRRLPEPASALAAQERGNLIAAIGERTAYFISAKSGRIVQRIDHGARLKTVALAPTGSVAATGGRDGLVRVWDAKTGRLLRVLDRHSGLVLAVRFSDDGTRLATGGVDGAARVWDPKSGALISTFSGHTGFVTSAAFTRDGARLITTSQDGTIRISEPETGHELLVLRGHKNFVTDATTDASGRILMSVGADRSIRIWDALPEPVLRPLRHTHGPVTSLSVSGTRLAASADKGVVVIDTRTGRVVRRLHTSGLISGVAFKPDGTTLAAVGAQGLTIWHGGSWQRIAGTGGLPLAAVAIAKDGRIAGASSRDTQLWTASGKPDRTLPGGATDVAVSPDGQLVATAARDSKVRIWKAATGKLLHELVGHRAPVTSVAFSPDGGRLVTASFDHDVRIWNLGTARTSHVLRAAFGVVSDASFSRDGRWVVAAGPASGTIWDAHNGQLLFFLRGSNGQLTSATFVGDSYRVVTGGRDGALRTYVCELCAPLDALERIAEHRLAGR